MFSSPFDRYILLTCGFLFFLRFLALASTFYFKCLSSGDIFSGKRVRTQKFFGGPLKHHLPSMFSGTRPQINNPIRLPHRLRIMLNNNDGISEVAKLF